MKKEAKKGAILGVTIVTIIAIMLYCLLWSIADDKNSDRNLTINGIIINIEHIGESDFYLYGELFEITFNNTDPVIVESASYSEDLLDFSPGRHLLITLWKDDPKYNWQIKQIVILG